MNEYSTRLWSTKWNSWKTAWHTGPWAVLTLSLILYWQVRNLYHPAKSPDPLGPRSQEHWPWEPFLLWGGVFPLCLSPTTPGRIGSWLRTCRLHHSWALVSSALLKSEQVTAKEDLPSSRPLESSFGRDALRATSPFSLAAALSRAIWPFTAHSSVCQLLSEGFPQSMMPAAECRERTWPSQGRCDCRLSRSLSRSSPASNLPQRGRGPPIRPSAPGPRQDYAHHSTCPSFCIRVHRSSASAPQSWATCKQALAYSPTTEFRRFNLQPIETRKSRCNQQNQELAPLCKSYDLEGLSAQVNGYTCWWTRAGPPWGSGDIGRASQVTHVLLPSTEPRPMEPWRAFRGHQTDRWGGPELPG